MYKLKPSVTVSLFGINKFENGGYEIIKKKQNFINSLTEALKFDVKNVELDTAAPWNKEEEILNFPFVKEACKIALDLGVTVSSAHLPFSVSWWDFASPNETNRVDAVNSFKRAVDSFGEFLPPILVVHPSAKPKEGEERQIRLNSLTKSMQEICNYTPSYICVENMVNDGLLNKISEAKELLNAAAKLFMTIDVNHSLLQPPEEYILQIGSKVKNLHISDNDGLKEQHWLPKKGVINFQKVLSALEKVGYNGTFNYELSLDKNGITYKDIKDNFEQLFNEYNEKTR